MSRSIIMTGIRILNEYINMRVKNHNDSYNEATFTLDLTL